jgi:signal transduction histidine kinase
MRDRVLRSWTTHALGPAVAALFAVMVLSIGTASWYVNRQLAERTIRALDTDIAHARDAYVHGGLPAVERYLARRAIEEPSVLYAVRDGERRVRGPLALASWEVVKDAVPFARAGGGLAVGRHVAFERGDVIIASDLADQQGITRTLQLAMLGSMGLTGLIAAMAARSARRRLLQRIDTITTASSAIMAGEFSRRIERDQSHDELDLLSDNLNQMLARIENLMQALRDVSDNIAHDLRTPLNRLRNTAEAALRDSGPAPVKPETLGKIIEEADQLIQTFNALLLIARLEPGMGNEHMEAIDITKLVGDAAELYDPVAEEAGLRLHVAPSLEVGTIRGNRQLIGQAVVNLIDNAIKYSAGQGGRVVSVSVMRQGSTVEIAVGDNGPGIPPQDRDRVLKRFVRLEASRSRPGTGLGLSLVAAVARLHVGSIRLEDNAPGLRAILVLPG